MFRSSVWLNVGAFITLALMLALVAGHQQSAAAQTSSLRAEGWSKPFIGSLKGHASISLGAQFWQNYFRVRNLIGRISLDLAPGYRAHLIARRREGNWQKMPLRPDIDEAYLEGSTHFHNDAWDFATSLRMGRVRYLRFPIPDQTSLFDTVTGIRDLTGGPVTDYRGLVSVSEVAHRSGFGFHLSAVSWGFDSSQHGLQPIEAYLFYRPKLAGGWSFEARAGGLAVRAEPMGLPAKAGLSGFLGKKIGEFEIGTLVENRRHEPIYTGVMIRFAPSDITRFLGAVGFDYARNPQGVAIQADLASWELGSHSGPSPDDELVGEVLAERVRTYWRQSFQRNEYEHRTATWGETGTPGLKMVTVTEPWRLELESLVSPHTIVDARWLRDRQGPAQLNQTVAYRFYRKRRSP